MSKTAYYAGSSIRATRCIPVLVAFSGLILIYLKKEGVQHFSWAWHTRMLTPPFLKNIVLDGALVPDVLLLLVITHFLCRNRLKILEWPLERFSLARHIYSTVGSATLHAVDVNGRWVATCEKHDFLPAISYVYRLTGGSGNPGMCLHENWTHNFNRPISGNLPHSST